MKCMPVEWRRACVSISLDVRDARHNPQRTLVIVYQETQDARREPIRLYNPIKVSNSIKIRYPIVAMISPYRKERDVDNGETSRQRKVDSSFNARFTDGGILLSSNTIS